MKKSKIIGCVVIVLAMLAVIGLYVYEVVFLKKPYTENLTRFLAIFVGLVGTMVKLFAGNARRRPLEFYSKQYDEEIRYAFKDNKFARKKLLCALRLYNENNYKKAIKYFTQLTKDIQNEHDAYAVYVFAANCFSECGIHNEAIKIYYQLLKHIPNNPTVHNNLSYEHMKDGNFDLAMQHIDEALRIDPYSYITYVNKANCYFYQYKLDETIENAKKALDLKNNDTNSAGLLAIVYSLKNDKENSEKYFRIAVNNGKNPKDINDAIEFYTTEKAEILQEIEDEKE